MADPALLSMSAVPATAGIRRLRSTHRADPYRLFVAAETPPAGAARRREAPSIAVLPFVNRSRDEADEYFSDGLADELLNVLAKIRGLRVAARSSDARCAERRGCISPKAIRHLGGAFG